MAALTVDDGAEGKLNSCNLSVNPLITLSVRPDDIFLTPSCSSVCLSVVPNTPEYHLEFDDRVVLITCPRFVSFFWPKALCLVKPIFFSVCCHRTEILCFPSSPMKTIGLLLVPLEYSSPVLLPPVSFVMTASCAFEVIIVSGCIALV